MGGRSLAVISSALYRNSCIKGRLAKGHPSALCHYYVCKLAARFSTPERRYNIARRFFLLRPLLLPHPPRPKFLRYRSRSFRSHFHFERIILNPCCYRLSCYRVSLTRKWWGDNFWIFSKDWTRECGEWAVFGKEISETCSGVFLIRSIFSTERNDIL